MTYQDSTSDGEPGSKDKVGSKTKNWFQQERERTQRRVEMRKDPTHAKFENELLRLPPKKRQQLLQVVLDAIEADKKGRFRW